MNGMDEPFPEMFDPKEHLEQAIKIVGQIKSKINECNNFDEADNYIISLTEKEKNNMSRVISEDEIKSEFDMTSMASLTIEADIHKDIYRLRETYETVQNALKKVGLDSNPADVDAEDITYVLNSTILEIVEVVRK
ncbi:hypothetical protein Zmor_004474 [Zophobas morio]|uniref:Uncharacterized protein n=1 Tax=Zophobas morio TaxID=2755281 RepID=A0AA38HI72_9CUCU|nr:hypothetical protein Zmor_004474 [Zophobas morio]